MDNFDEYQKLMRYKYGYHAFGIVLVLTLINYFFSLFYDFHWAETGEVETMVIVMLAIMYSLIMYIYKGAYFSKRQSPKFYAIMFFVVGTIYIIDSFSPYTTLIANGKVTSNILLLIGGIMWLAIPTTYLTRVVVENIREKKDSN